MRLAVERVISAGVVGAARGVRVRLVVGRVVGAIARRVIRRDALLLVYVFL